MSIADGIPSAEELYVASILGVTTFIGQLLVYFKGLKPPPPNSRVQRGIPAQDQEVNEQANGPKLGMLIG